MKIVHISTTDYGGAYRAAANISRAMCMCGADSKVIVREKHSGEDVIPYCDTRLRVLASKTKNVFNLMASRGEIINDLFGSDITSMKEVQEADVIILHWVNSFISYSEVEKLCAMGKPVFWVMHDMWCFTGGCHLDYGCAGYVHGCGKCPILHSSSSKDITSRIFLEKKASWDRSVFTPIGPSRYMKEAAEKSPLFDGREVLTIPNPVDTEIFIKNEVSEQRKKTILFGALKPGEFWKGMDLLTDALKHIDSDKYRIVICGRPEDVEDAVISQETIKAGMVSSRKKMAELYSRADVFVIPSRQENLSNSVLESLSCSIPAVAFDIGGMSDMIEHKINGYLANPFDTEDFAAGIEYCAEHKAELGAAARQKAVDEFSMKVIGEKYVRLCAGACKHNNNDL